MGIECDVLLVHACDQTYGTGVLEQRLSMQHDALANYTPSLADDALTHKCTWRHYLLHVIREKQVQGMHTSILANSWFYAKMVNVVMCVRHMMWYSFYQLAACFTCSQLLLRLFYIFHIPFLVCWSIGLCVPTYHMHNDYIMYTSCYRVNLLVDFGNSGGCFV